MKYKLFIIIIAIIIITLLFVGCNNEVIKRSTDENTSTDIDSPSNDCLAEPDISGEILDVTNNKIIRVLVDSKSESIKGQIWVSIDEKTSFNDSKGESFKPEDIESLFEVGNKISFLSNGIIMESYPMQTSALCVYLN